MDDITIQGNVADASFSWQFFVRSLEVGDVFRVDLRDNTALLEAFEELLDPRADGLVSGERTKHDERAQSGSVEDDALGADE